MAAIRLDKMLADSGCGTRSQVKEWIRKGRVTINGQTIKKPECKVDPTFDRILLDQEAVSYETYHIYMLHKPAGYVSATEDAKEQTVLELLPSNLRKGLFPVGRLDKDTEGLLLLTDNGALAHRLLSPKRHVDKTYFAMVNGPMEAADQAAFEAGMDIGDEKPTLPGKLKILTSGESSEVEITICEGRFHQVKRMVEARGKQVTYLKRLSMGPIALDPELEKGCWRPLTGEERSLLENEV